MYDGVFEVFYDGDCPLCMREIRMLMRLDRNARIKFTDIAEPTFDPAAIGTSYETLMERIHGRMPDGSWVQGVEVFRQLYARVGLAPLVAVTRAPGVRAATRPIVSRSRTSRSSARARAPGRSAGRPAAPLPVRTTTA